MLTQQERAEIRYEVHRELAEINEQCAHAGSYGYLCYVGGLTFFSHHPVGHVLRRIA